MQPTRPAAALCFRPPSSDRPGQSRAGWTSPRSSRSYPDQPRSQPRSHDGARAVRRGRTAPLTHMQRACFLNQSMVQPSTAKLGQPLDLPRAIMKHLDVSHSPMNIPLAEATQNRSKLDRRKHEHPWIYMN
ncbi:XIAP-associated factor 1 [Dorcoceras hygrometricum]|uniref:XIAP-associated factor 1 n=1 Tax=Dorcoceras hygrometricum TaxID=472368 RepID=A0A2Z7A3I1_9LAMI|nr:XIAP-associated factor 1 [Dorcoceras hygrometricum]